ncbi:hypothetical protein B0H13DRAFT_2371983 [Mycena leptocephala]|nr:hypothetical protein B0H13DRAFT_2371983 [Mycena leptocephala]
MKSVVLTATAEALATPSPVDLAVMFYLKKSEDEADDKDRDLGEKTKSKSQRRGTGDFTEVKSDTREGQRYLRPAAHKYGQWENQVDDENAHDGAAMRQGAATVVTGDEKQFLSGMQDQHCSTSTRIRRQAGAAIYDCAAGDLTPTLRDQFREEIGWNGSEYASLDVPILHKDGSREYDIHSCFLSPVPMRLFVALSRGPSAAAVMLKSLESAVILKSDNMGRIHHIEHSEPGAHRPTGNYLPGLHVVCVEKVLINYKCEPLCIRGDGVLGEYQFEPSPEEVLEVGLSDCIYVSFSNYKYSHFIVF